MLITFWNVRGLQKPHKQSVVKDFCYNNLDIFGILESRFTPRTPTRFINKYFLNWNFINNFDVVKNGRILLLWNPLKVQVTINKIEKQVIHVTVISLADSKTFYFIFCYGFYQVTNGREMWDSHLKRPHGHSSFSWGWLQLCYGSRWMTRR